MGVKGLKKNVFYPFTLSCCSNVGSMSVSEKLPTYPSPKPTLTLTCYHLMVFWVRGGVNVHMLILIPNVYSVATELFTFLSFITFQFGQC